tara:strand:- start:227 stop:565 length:339 start_codon:yes stop_codon:yes gene_type:complete
MKASPIRIAGKIYPVKYGFAAIRNYCEITGSALDDFKKFKDEMTVTQAVAICWAGLKDGARVMKKPFDMELDDVSDLVDVDEDALFKIIAVFAEHYGAEEDDKPKKKGSKKK